MVGTKQYQYGQRRGFSLIEMLLVLFIMTSLMALIIANFRTTTSGSIAQKQAASRILGDIRRAQLMALSGAQYQDEAACGYGIHYDSPQSYILYAEVAPVGQCATTDRTYQTGVDGLVETQTLGNVNLQFDNIFSDIYFESPNATTYIAGSQGVNATITVRDAGSGFVNCGVSGCTDIVVMPTGKIDVN